MAEVFQITSRFILAKKKMESSFAPSSQLNRCSIEDRGGWLIEYTFGFSPKNTITLIAMEKITLNLPQI